MNNEQQIKQLEECNQELQKQERLLRAQIELQAKQIEALKTAPAQSDEERFGPYEGAGYCLDDLLGKRSPCGENKGRRYYYAYPTEAQAEWEFKATQVRRKLQRICAVLGPAKVGEITRDATSLYTVKFARFEDAQEAERILGDDIKYLNWNNSPEAKDAMKVKSHEH